MSRIRSIKPEFWSSEQVMNCSRESRLFFIGMWNFADDSGRLSVAEKTLKAQIFPGDLDVDSQMIRRMLVELSSNYLIRIYEVAEHEYLEITGWHHQRIDRPRPSKYPDPPIPQNSTNDRRGLAPDLSLPNPNGAYLRGGGSGSLASREGTLANRGPSQVGRRELEEILNKRRGAGINKRG